MKGKLLPCTGNRTKDPGLLSHLFTRADQPDQPIREFHSGDLFLLYSRHRHLRRHNLFHSGDAKINGSRSVPE